MKAKQFRTSNGLFVIVEYSDIETHLHIKGVTHVFSKKNNSHFTHVGDPISVENITEQQASEIVDKSIHTYLFAHYVKDIPVNTYCYLSAIESLHSLIKSLGIHLFKNPYLDFETLDIDAIEAESDTFYNPHIFKIVE